MNKSFIFNLFALVVFCEFGDSSSISDFNDVIRVPRSILDSEQIRIKRLFEKVGQDIYNMKKDIFKLTKLENLEEKFDEKLMELESKVVNIINRNLENMMKTLSDRLDSIQSDFEKVSNKSDSFSEFHRNETDKIKIDIEQRSSKAASLYKVQLNETARIQREIKEVTQKLNNLKETTADAHNKIPSEILISTKEILNGSISKLKHELEATWSTLFSASSSDAASLHKVQLNETARIKREIEQLSQKIDNRTTEARVSIRNEVIKVTSDQLKASIQGLKEEFNSTCSSLLDKISVKAEFSHKMQLNKTEKMKRDIEEITARMNAMHVLQESSRLEIGSLNRDLSRKTDTTLERRSRERANHTCSNDGDCEYWRYCSSGRYCHNRNIKPEFGPQNRTTVSLLESNKLIGDQISGCGGAVVGASGYITFQPDESRLNTRFTCIWTIRANLYEKVAFILKSGDFGPNSDMILFVSPLKAYIWNNSTVSESVRASSSKTISSTEVEYVVDGPVVFLTLVGYSTSSLSSTFEVYYKGRGENTNSSTEYRHYHFEASEGELNYPRIRNAEKYSPNEVATFVFNPKSPLVTLDLKYVGLETHTGCRFDALTFLLRANSFNSYNIVGHPKYTKEKRYCMINTALTDARFPTAEAYIVTFNSDSSAERTGFKISWF